MNSSAYWRCLPLLLVCLLNDASPGSLHAGENVYIVDVPDYQWRYGCMATASGNLMGFWDRNGFPGFYIGNVNGGLAPLNAYGTNSGITGMWASKAGVDGRPQDKPGHVDDYYTAFEDAGPDPYVVAGRPEHEPDSIADFIGMDQFKWQSLRGECRGNIDGYCFVSWDPTGAKRINHVPDPLQEEPEVDVQTGLRAWAKWRGYDAEVYTQLADFNPTKPRSEGFTFADLKAEIDNGYPVLLFLQEYYQMSRTVAGVTNVNPLIHAMLAYGYVNTDQRVRYRTSWADGNNKFSVWAAFDWQADLPLRGVIGFRPKPKIMSYKAEAADLRVEWHGPAARVFDVVSQSTNRVHGYVVELSPSSSPMTFTPVSPVLLDFSYTITNCPSPSYVRVRLVRP